MDLNQTVAVYQEQIRKIARNGQITNLDEFQDGRVTRTLLEQGHSVENIEQAIAKFSPVAIYRQAAWEIPEASLEKYPYEYAAKLITNGQNVINAMNAIKEFDVSKLDGAKLDSFSEYKQLVRQQMEEKGGIALNSKMDADIAYKMFQRGHSQTDIEEAISKVSPVAQEAGRSPEKYSEYVMGKAVESWERHLEKQKMAEANYSSTAQEYLDRKEAGRRALQEGRSEAYQDGRIVRELMDKGHDRDNLIKVVAENAAEKEGRTRDGYAKYIVNSVSAEIRAEQGIRSFDVRSIEEGEPFTLQQIYLHRAQQLFVRSQGESYSSFIDDRVATSMVKDGVGEPEEIKKVIQELSPAGKRPGMVPDYPEKVMERANQRIAFEQELDKRYPAVAYDYMKNAETMKNANPGRDYSDYMDGKIAQRLLEKGHDKENVQKVLGELSMVAQRLQERGWDGERYGRTIVDRTVQSMARYEAMKSSVIEPKTNWANEVPPAKEAYQNVFYVLLDPTKPYFNASNDIDTSRVLFKEGYEPAEIKQAIIEASPVAIEAGRNPENYAKYVQEKAFGPSLEREDIKEFLHLLEQEALAKRFQMGTAYASEEVASMAPAQTSLEKSQRIEELRNVVSEIESGKSLTVAEGYKVEAAKLITQEKSWTGPESDVKITQSLLLQGYDKGKIAAVISRQSPEILGKTKEEAKKYSNETTKKAMTPEIKKQMSAPAPGGMKM